MSTLKLKGSTSGYVELTAPATAGDNTITLPTTAGSVVVADGSGNVNVSGIVTAASLNTTGNVEVGTGVTIYGSAGIVSATSFYGSGANLTGISASGTTGNFTVTNGNVVVSNGYGIDFSANADGLGTTTSELLDDYEEGTFTPELYFDNTEIGTRNASQSAARYVKIGMVVHVNGVIAYSSINTSSGTYLRIRGLPFNVYEYGQPNNWTQPGIIRVNGNAPSEFAIAAGNSATNRAICIYNNSGATDAYVTNSVVSGWNGNNRTFWFALTYYTTS